jgi:phosphatidylglycerophosphatase C
MTLKKIAFFDLDGTITEKDTLFEFLKEFVSRKKILINLIIIFPLIILSKLKFIDSGKPKAFLIFLCLNKIPESQIRKKAEDFSLLRLPQLMRPSMDRRLEWHKMQKHEIVIVSASFDFWIRPWSIKNGYSLISSEINFHDGFITAEMRGKNCKGQEKLRRVKSFFNLQEYEYIYAYGNEKSDRYLLNIAHEAYNNNFNF